MTEDRRAKFIPEMLTRLLRAFKTRIIVTHAIQSKVKKKEKEREQQEKIGKQRMRSDNGWNIRGACGVALFFLILLCVTL